MDRQLLAFVGGAAVVAIAAWATIHGEKRRMRNVARRAVMRDPDLSKAIRDARDIRVGIRRI